MVRMSPGICAVGVFVVALVHLPTTWAQSDELPGRLRQRISRTLVDDGFPSATAAFDAETRITRNDGEAGDRFGYNLALSGDTAVVGAWADGAESGSAYVYERNKGGPDNWGLVRRVTASDGARNDRFGTSVAISGDFVIVGAPLDDLDDVPCPSAVRCDSGSAYVYRRDAGGKENWGLVTKITASDADVRNNFGLSVGISGDTAIVGARQIDSNGRATGAAYLYRGDVGGKDNWGEVTKITASDGASFSQFGASVAIDGDTAIVGDVLASAAYLFRRDETVNDLWREVAKITASDGVENQLFGTSVAINDGTAIVGAPHTDDGGSVSGSAFVYLRHEGGTENWGEVTKISADEQANNSSFGFSVAINGDTATVGSHADNQNGADSGAAYVYTRDSGGKDNWGQVSKFTASDGTIGDLLGYSVATNGGVAIVGAWAERSFSGAAYVYQPNAGDFDDWSQVVKITASGGAIDDRFSAHVAISGDIAIVGAQSEIADKGAAYVFRRDDGGIDDWGNVTRITASDGVMGNQFGISVGLSGDTAIVGAHRSDTNEPDPGSAYIYRQDKGGANNWGEVIKLVAGDGVIGDAFGCSVAIDGDTAIVGANLDNDNGLGAGSAYVFQRNNGGSDNWDEVTKLIASHQPLFGFFGWDVAIDDDTAIVGAPGGDLFFGAAYLYRRDAGGPDNWGEVARINASDPVHNSLFGGAVALSGDTAIVSAPGTDDDGNNSGSVYIYQRDKGGLENWGEVTKITAVDAAALDSFGFSVGISGDTAIVGAHGHDANGENTGSVFVYRRDVGGMENWGLLTNITATAVAPNDGFGGAVDICGDRAIVRSGRYGGSAYVYSTTPCTTDEQCADGDDCNGVELCNLETGLCVDGEPVDCNGNGIDDACDLADCDGGPECQDSDANGVLDLCEFSCTDNASCANADPCSFDRCIENRCSYDIGARYGDVASADHVCGPDGDVTLDDIIAVLDGFAGQFAEGCEMVNIDIAGAQGGCDPDGQIHVTDILGVLNAFAGSDRCCAGRR